MTIEELRASPSATITVKDAAAVLGVNPRTVSAALSIHGGDVPARRVGRRVVIPREPFIAWLLGERPKEDVPPSAPAVDTTALVRAKLVELLGALENVA